MTEELKQRFNRMVTSSILCNSLGERYWSGRKDDFGYGILENREGICTNYRVRITPVGDDIGEMFLIEHKSEFA